MRSLSTQQQRVLDVSEELFFRYGLSRVTTEEIAKMAGISKKTLYSHFRSKSDIVSVLFMRAARSVRDVQTQLRFDDVTTYRENLTQLAQTASTMVACFSVPLLEDLRSLEPRLYARFERARDRWLHGMLRDALAKGQSVGAVRTIIQPDIAAAVLLRMSIAVIHPDHRPRDGSSPSFATMVRILLDGVVRPRD